MQVVLGLDFGGSKIAVAVSDLTGKRVADTVVPTIVPAGAEVNLRYGIDAGKTLLGKIGGAELIAVGASTFGIPDERGVRLAPAIPGWQDLRLAQELGRAFPGAAVRVVTDVKAAAYAENDSGALAGCDPGLYLNLGTGLAVAIVSGGTVISGSHGASGEIGYSLRTLADVGRPVDDRALLEQSISGMGLARSASARTASARATGAVAVREMTAADVFAATDSRSTTLVAEFVAELAFHLVNLTIAIDPARIVVGGGMAGSWDRLQAGLRRALDAGVPYPPELMLARYPFDAPLRGALLIAGAAAGIGTRPVSSDPIAPDPIAPDPIASDPIALGPARSMRKEQSR